MSCQEKCLQLRHHEYPTSGIHSGGDLLTKEESPDLRTIKQRLGDALQKLLGVCDGAIAKDGHGFSKVHTWLANQYGAQDPQSWSLGDIKTVYELLTPYQKQLKRDHDIDLSDIVPPNPRQAQFLRGGIRLCFEYKPDIVFELKQISLPKQYLAHQKCWQVRLVGVSASELSRLKHFLQKYQFEYCPTDQFKNLEDCLVSKDDEAKTAQETDGSLRIRFGFEPEFKGWLDQLKQSDVIKQANENEWIVPPTPKGLQAYRDLLKKLGRDIDSWGWADKASQLIARQQRKLFAPDPQGELCITFPYHSDIVKTLQEWRNRHGLLSFEKTPQFIGWKLEPSPYSPTLVETLVNQYQFSLAESARQWLDHLQQRMHQNEIARQNSLASDKKIETAGLTHSLYEFQEVGARFIERNKRVLLGDDMGLGKTIQAIAVVARNQLYPCLVICPSSMKYQWQSQFEAWADPKPKILVICGKKKISDNPSDYQVVIINYDILESHMLFLKRLKPQIIICDESHLVKNHEAKRTKCVKQLARSTPYRLLMSGSPMLNRPKELISQLSILGRLEDFGGFWEFARRYCNATLTEYGWNLDGASNLKELREKLQQSCFLRRTKEEVLSELPPINREEVAVQIADKHYSEYLKAKKDLSAWVWNKVLSDPEIQQQVNQIADEKDRRSYLLRVMRERLGRAERAEALVKIESLKQIVGRGKVEIASEWIENALESIPKMVVFGTHHEVLESLYQKFGDKACLLTGQTPAIERQKMVESFQNDPAVRLFIANIQSGGVGITLTAASHALFLEFPWSPKILEQAEDRLHRIGQNDRVFVTHMVDPRTIDRDILNLLEHKNRVIDGAIDTGEEVDADSLLSGLLTH